MLLFSLLSIALANPPEVEQLTWNLAIGEVENGLQLVRISGAPRLRFLAAFVLVCAGALGLVAVLSLGVAWLGIWLFGGVELLLTVEGLAEVCRSYLPHGLLVLTAVLAAIAAFVASRLSSSGAPPWSTA